MSTGALVPWCLKLAPRGVAISGLPNRDDDPAKGQKFSSPNISLNSDKLRLYPFFLAAFYAWILVSSPIPVKLHHKTSPKNRVCKAASKDNDCSPQYLRR